MNQQQKELMRLRFMLSHRRRQNENAYIFGLIAIALAIGALGICAAVYLFLKT